MEQEVQHGTTFPKLFLENAARFPAERTAIREKDLGIWQSHTWKQSLAQARDRSTTPAKNKGCEAARTAIETANVVRFWDALLPDDELTPGETFPTDEESEGR